MKRFALLAVLALAALPACEGGGNCTPTHTEAPEANRVDLTATSQSSTLSAKLTVEETGEGLGAKTMRFAVLDDGAEVYSEDATTQSDGNARLDLKRIDVGALQAIARGDEYTATFPGDGTYCSSQDAAEFKVVRAPAGVSIGAP